MGKIIRFSLAASLILTLLSLLVVDPIPTSKVSWEYQHGFPLRFLVLGRYTGPCSQSNDCSRLYLESFDAGKFVLDLVLFGAAGALAYQVSRGIRDKKRHIQRTGSKTG